MDHFLYISSPTAKGATPDDSTGSFVRMRRRDVLAAGRIRFVMFSGEK
jgi:hypothetical protein